MEQSPLRLIKRSAEYLSDSEVSKVPKGLRGLYVLYKKRGEAFDVVYVGMTVTGRTGGVRGRLVKHLKEKQGEWNYFSVFQVWDNVRDEEIVELEGLFRHIYRHDSKANRLNVRKGFKKLNRLKSPEISDWD